MASIFLTAEWRWLVVVNFEIDPSVLAPWVPRGTELDHWDGKALVSVVGFQFLKTRVCGVPVPFHTDFDEVNLRFYVRRWAADGWRRGVVFVKEIVPRWAIAAVARLFYNENYVALRMGHRLPERPAGGGMFEYRWRVNGEWNRLSGRTVSGLEDLVPGSEAEFILEHYWGYARQPDGGTVEYEVQHPRWRVFQVEDAVCACDAGLLYGEQFGEALSARPCSAYVAEGSPVAVFRGQRVGVPTGPSGGDL